MAESSPNPSLSPLRAGVAVAIALLGSALVWVAVPYNNFLLQNTYLSDSYLPEIVVAFLLLIVLAVNPLLRCLGPRWTLTPRQLGLIVGLMLFAAVIPSNGLMRMFPRLVAEFNRQLNEGAVTARVGATADLPGTLFPDPLPSPLPGGAIQTHETPVSSRFLDALDPGQTIPWHAWIAPMASWGFLILAIWAMMLGLGGVVYPQWRNNERLPFPLLNVYHALIGDPESPHGRLLPEVFASKMFWIATGTVFFIHAMRALNLYTGAVPSIPLSWNIQPYFNDGVFLYAPRPFFAQLIFFSIVGVAYFIPSRYSISIWVWVIGYGTYQMFGRAYLPTFDEDQAYQQSTGILMAIAAWVIWLGRFHWARVLRAMLGRSALESDTPLNAVAGWMFAIGCAGIAAWLWWAGCALWWSLAATAGCVVISLLIARIIAETGIPVLWLTVVSAGWLTDFFPLAWQSPAILLFTAALYMFIIRGSAVNATVMTTFALAMDRKATPSHHRRLLLGGLGLMALGFVVCGAVHLCMGYHHDSISTTIKVGANTIDRWETVSSRNEVFFDFQRQHQVVGLGVGSTLLWLCSRYPSWPIHPVGILFVRNSIGFLVWFSVFLGWLSRAFITRLFGSGVYRTCRPLFMGLIMGELLAIIFWAIVPIIIIWTTGQDPAVVTRYILIQYP